MTLGEVRWYFWVLIVSAMVSLYGAHWVLWSASAIAAATGILFLYADARSARTLSALRTALSDGLVRAVLPVLLVLVAATAYVFSVAFAINLALLFGAAVLATSRIRGAQAVRGLLVGSAVGGFGAMVLLGLGEVAFSGDALASRFGPPAEKARWASLYAAQVKTNTFGLRTPHETVARSPSSLRIVTVGDSFTFGEVVESPNDVWPAQLEQRLAVRHPESSIEVINMGRGGFTTGHHEERLRRLGWQFSPDVVIVQFLCNDPIPSSENYELDTGRRDQLYPRVQLLPVRFRTGAVSSSALFDFIQSRLGGVIAGSAIPRYKQLFADGEPGWIQSKSALRAIASEGDRRGVPVVLMLFPEFFPGSWTAETYPLRDEYAMVSDVAEDAGFHVMNLIPVFAEGGGDWRRWWGTNYDSHPNEAAHAMAADALLDFLWSSDFYWDALPVDVASAMTDRPHG